MKWSTVLFNQMLFITYTSDNSGPVPLQVELDSNFLLYDCEKQRSFITEINLGLNEPKLYERT